MRKVLVLLALLIPWHGLFSQENDNVQLVNDVQSLRCQLRVRGDEGRIALADVFRAISRYNGYDDKELDRLPAGNISLDGRAAAWIMAAINKTLRPCVHVETEVGDKGKATLAITVDRESARAWVNRRKSQVRWAWSQMDWREEPPDYGLQILRVTNDQDPQDLVVLIHGLNSRPEDVAGFIPLVERAELVPVAFRYPNDQPIDASSALLAEELRELAQAYPHRKVRILAHSMGGLVARGALESELDPGNVYQLIMVGTPNHGSSLARVASFMDCYEFCTSAHYRRPGVLVESVSDGLGEATADLTPNSVFLDRLNGYERNPRVRYSIILGTNGPMLPEEMNSIRMTVGDYSAGNWLSRFFASKLNKSLASLDEVVQGKGDGVVSCERGRLNGIADIQELPFSHAGVLVPNSKGSKAAHAEILARLKMPL